MEMVGLFSPRCGRGLNALSLYPAELNGFYSYKKSKMTVEAVPWWALYVNFTLTLCHGDIARQLFTRQEISSHFNIM